MSPARTPGSFGIGTLALLVTLGFVLHGDEVAADGSCNNLTILTTSTKTSSETQSTDLSARVDTFVSRVLATDASGVVVVDQTFPVASDDPTVQAALAAAHDALAGGVTSALHTIVGPALTTTVDLLDSHAVTVETGREQLEPTETVTTYFAPDCIGVGDLDVPNTEPCTCNGGACASTNIPPAGTPLCLVQGGSVIDDLTDTHTIIHATRTTTDSYRTSTTLALRATVLDEFTVYAAKATPKLKTFGPVTLADALGTADYDVKGVAALGLPAAPLGATASDGVTHLLRYPVKRRKGASKFAARTIDGTDGCGPVAVQVLKPESLLVPVRVDLATFPPPPDPAATGVDAFLCYKAKGPKLAKGAQVDAGDQFESRRYDLKKVTRLCEPVTTNGSGVTATQLHRPGALLTCYQSKVAKKTIAQTSCAPTTPGDKGTKLTQPKDQKRSGLQSAGALGHAALATGNVLEVCLPTVATAP